jgi:hypothetical protein
MAIGTMRSPMARELRMIIRGEGALRSRLLFQLEVLLRRGRFDLVGGDRIGEYRARPHAEDLAAFLGAGARADSEPREWNPAGTGVDQAPPLQRR